MRFDPEPISRRSVLRLAMALGATTAACGGRPTPLLVEGAAPAPARPAPPSEATPEGWRPPVDMTVQQAARSERTHSPCFRAAMEERALAESLAADALEDALAASPGQATALVGEYRRELAEIRATFQARIATC